MGRPEGEGAASSEAVAGTRRRWSAAAATGESLGTATQVLCLAACPASESKVSCLGWPAAGSAHLPCRTSANQLLTQLARHSLFLEVSVFLIGP